MRRGYHQHCGLARCLDVVGERWTLLIVRELLLGPRRYSDLLAELPGITTNLLAKRLRELRDRGLIARTQDGPVEMYALTPEGAALEPAIMALAHWGSRLMEAGPGRGDRLDVGWVLLGSKRRYRGGVAALVEIASGARTFELELTPSRVFVSERASPHAELRIEGDFRAIAGLTRGAGVALARTGALLIEGDRSRYLTIARAFADRELHLGVVQEAQGDASIRTSPRAPSSRRAVPHSKRRARS